MRHIPITLDEANEFVALHHRHNKAVHVARFCLGAVIAGRLVGVAVVGTTRARLLHSGITAEVYRICVADGGPRNVCSFLYGKCRRVWQAMGGERMVTYTLDAESGASLRAAGWIPKAKTRGGQWGRLRRARKDQPVCAMPKIRWEAPK